MPRPAGFWIRVVATLIDLAVIFVVKGLLGVLAARTWRGDVQTLGIQGALALSTLLFAAAYVIVLHAVEGQTIGKLVVRVRVVSLDGSPPPLGASVLRFLACFASAVPLGFGFVMAGLRRDRRALHDLLAGTRVERLAPAPRPAPLEPPPAPAL